MAIEAAMREARILHQVGHADAVVTFFAEQSGRHVHDALAVQRCLFPAHLHAASTMMLIII